MMDRKKVKTLYKKLTSIVPYARYRWFINRFFIRYIKEKYLKKDDKISDEKFLRNSLITTARHELTNYETLLSVLGDGSGKLEYELYWKIKKLKSKEAKKLLKINLND